MPITLETKIQDLPRVSPAYQKRLLKLGIKTLRDLFFHFPRRYNDFSKITRITNLSTGTNATVQGRIIDIKNIRTWKKRITITQAYIQDNTSSIKIIWFNQPYLTKSLKIDDVINVSGKVNLDKDLYFSNPAYEKISGQLKHTGRIVPIYPETAGLSSRYLRYIIQLYLPAAKQIEDWLPKPIKSSQRLLDLNTAIAQVHFPFSSKNASQARRRLAFEELFLIQIFVLSQKIQRTKEQAQPIPFNETLIRDFVAKLPFSLTAAQKKAAWETFQDLTKNNPMNRLIEGDVGSGKTVVAAMAALEVAKAEYQVAFMAPTEILAKQHFKNIQNLLRNQGLKIGLLTSSAAKENDTAISKKLLAENIKNGQTAIIIGTQALIQKQIEFKNLVLAIVDEQHRFGVQQRAALQKNVSGLPDGLAKKIPHLLSLTATPIPRSLALTIYGDLDLSLINELPKGRQKIITRLVPPAKRTAAYEFIRQQAKQGRQIFVVCPRIEPTENSSGPSLATIEIKAAKDEYEKLSKEIFPELKIALLHGKIKSQEKETIMADFVAGRIDILVATSVIEVGIDIPNATIMMIEGAERFGLAQLHQLRGRVGRSGHQSYCLLFTDSASVSTQSRLKIMTNCSDGFKLAEHDLQLRGPGEFFGSNQSGLPDLPMSSLIDLIMVKQARDEAAKILRQDSELNGYPLLKEKIKKFQENIHLE